MTDDATRTLGKGSIPPGPVPEGVIRLYSMRFCPYAHRTRLVLRAKGIRDEVNKRLAEGRWVLEWAILKCRIRSLQETVRTTRSKLNDALVNWVSSLKFVKERTAEATEAFSDSSMKCSPDPTPAIFRHEVININLRNKPEWYFTKHPFGQIPVLENSKCQLIYESVIACEYLDDAYPGRKLYPYDPYERARQKMLLELFYKVPHLTKECLVALRCRRDCVDLKLALRQEFCNLEEILGYQHTVFFGGDCISMIDYLFWPWFERLEVYGIADCVNHTPTLQLWIAAMKQDPTVCSLLTDKNTFLGFLNLYFQNNPGAFDYGLSC